MIRNKKGQSTVEYLLLMMVVVSVTLAFMNSAAFKRFVGKDSDLMKKLFAQMSYAYRHGRAGGGVDEVDNSDYSTNHETYFDADEGRSRFFVPLDKYPE